MLEELLFFSEFKFPKKSTDDLGNIKIPPFALLIKRTNENLTGNIDDVVLQLIYGNSRETPGDEKSPAQKLRKVWLNGKLNNWEDVEEEDKTVKENFDNIVIGIWAPPNSLCRASCLKLLFSILSAPFHLVDVKITPLHLALAYDAYKAKDIFELSEKYPAKVMSFGYFSNDVPGEATLLGKTADKYDARTVPVTYEEKVVIQLVKDSDMQCFLDFLDMGPSYVSSDVEVGELDCNFFFPPDYNKPEAEIITYLKKKRRRGKFPKIRIQKEQLLEGETPTAVAQITEADAAEANAEQTGEENEEDTLIGDEANNEEGESEEDDEEGENEEEEEQDEEGMENADKATSPVES